MAVVVLVGQLLGFDVHALGVVDGDGGHDGAFGKGCQLVITLDHTTGNPCQPKLGRLGSYHAIERNGLSLSADGAETRYAASSVGSLSVTGIHSCANSPDASSFFASPSTSHFCRRGSCSAMAVLRGSICITGLQHGVGDLICIVGNICDPITSAFITARHK